MSRTPRWAALAIAQGGRFRAAFAPVSRFVAKSRATFLLERSMSLADEISKLSELRASGGLTEEEFQRAKQRLLSESPRPDGALASAVNTFRRSRTDRWLGGVCGGMARSTDLASWVWRLLFAVLFVFAGAGLLIYVLLWIFVPSE
jgi:phage shock protein PspC (stress-responsive transcriptional regulator)